MILTYKFRAYPNKSQVQYLNDWVDYCCEVQNAALEARIDAYRKQKNRKQKNRKQKETINAISQGYDIKEIRKIDERAVKYPCGSYHALLKNLDKTYSNFFRGLKTGRKVGFPKFKSRRFYNTVWVQITNPKRQEAPFHGNKFKVQKFLIKVKIHRDIPVGALAKNYGFKRQNGKWFLLLQLEMPSRRKKTAKRKKIGIDLGVKTFAVFSDGKEIEHPKFFGAQQKELRRLQRSLARKKRGSRKREKAKQDLQRFYEKTSNQKRNWLHHQTLEIADGYGLVATEKLNVKGMLKKKQSAGCKTLRRNISEASFSEFNLLLKYKCEERGVEYKQVNPKNTSQRCSECGKLPKQKKDLSVRTHKCEYCGYTSDRDLNAAKNILQKAEGKWK